MLGSRGLLGSLRAPAAQSRPCSAPTVRPPGRRSLVVVAVSKPIEKLKRAPSAYNLFYKAKYAEVRSKLNTGAGIVGMAECAGTLQKMWTALPEKEKVKYEEESKKLKELHAAAKAAGTLEVPKKKKVKRDGPPRPMTPYAAFTKAEFAGFKSKFPTLTVGEIAKKIGEKWQGLPQKTKDDAKAVYDGQMKVYKANEAAAAAAAPPAPAPAKPAAKAAPATPAARPSRSTTPTAAAAAPKRTTPAPPAAPAKASTPVKAASPLRTTTKRATPPK